MVYIYSYEAWTSATLTAWNVTRKLFWESRTHKRRDTSIFENIFFCRSCTRFNLHTFLVCEWRDFSVEALVWRLQKMVKCKLKYYCFFNINYFDREAVYKKSTLVYVCLIGSCKRRALWNYSCVSVCQ